MLLHVPPLTLIALVLAGAAFGFYLCAKGLEAVGHRVSQLHCEHCGKAIGHPMTLRRSLVDEQVAMVICRACAPIYDKQLVHCPRCGDHFIANTGTGEAVGPAHEIVMTLLCRAFDGLEHAQFERMLELFEPHQQLEWLEIYKAARAFAYGEPWPTTPIDLKE
jgi:uncharacterized Zn-finger protein